MSEQNKMIGGLVMSNKENFLFLASWHDILEGYDNAGKPEMASEIAKQIIYYGVTGKMTSDDPVVVGIVTGMCAALIDRSKKRYNTCVANGKKGGRPKQYNVDDMMCEMHLYQVASLVRNNSVVCYDTVMETNFGGIYPIVSHTYECYDLASGNIYDFGYLAEGEWSEALYELLYAKLEAEHGDSILISSPQTTHLPHAIYLTDTGITFQYQPYEIGSIDIGSISVEISDEELTAAGVPIVWE